MEATQKPTFKQKLETLMNEYGPVALGVYLSLFGVVMLGFVVAIKMGFKPDSAAGEAGTWFAAWLAAKATTPLRIAATFALTPLVAKLWQKKPRAS